MQINRHSRHPIYRLIGKFQNLINTKPPVSLLVTLMLLSLFMTQTAVAGVAASDMVGSSSQNLNSFTNPFNGAFSSAADGFQKYQRGVSASIPFAITDDSLSIFTGDKFGIITEGNTDVFFGVADTVNSNTSGPVSAIWEFDISGAVQLGLSIDMGAMGDFETSDTFEWTYSIDGGPTLVAFTAVTDDAGVNTYTLEGGASFMVNDPTTMQGVILTNNLATFSTLISGDGSVLTLTFTANTNGGDEAFAFQNLIVTDDNPLPPPGIAFDMFGSTSSNLNSFTNPFNGAFTSLGDGFQKYQRGVSASIPFAIADDSLTFLPDELGIIKTGNTDEFFGVVVTQNPQNSGPVSASWAFDVTGAQGLGLSIDMGAMGDFESSDTMEWTYSVDGGPTLTAFVATVDNDGSNDYILESGTEVTLKDPMLMQGTILTNNLATFSTSLAGQGSELVVTLTVVTNGGSEAIAFQNLIVTDGNEPPALLELEIWEIQGAGSASPFVGNQVLTDDDVVTTLASNGFFMQSLAARSDGDINTSDGIFVFTGGAPAVAVGDLVDVNGQISEFFGFTEISADSVVVEGTGAIPPVVVFDATVPSPDPMGPSCAIEYECYEGMLIQITGGTVTGPNQRFSSDTVAEVHITAASERTFREPGIEFPGLPGLPEWDGNPEVFELDANKLGLGNDPIPAGSHFDATGVLGFEFGGYELWPSSLSVTPAALPSAVRSREANEMTVGALNLFRLFDDIDDPDVDVIDPETEMVIRTTREAIVSTDEYQRRLTKLSAYIREVLGAPDILAVSEVESVVVLQDLADKIAADDATLAYTAYLEEGNDIGGIDVGFLTLDTVVVDNVTQLGRFEILDFDDSLLNDRPPLLLEARQVADGSDFPIAVIAIHGRSLGGIDGSNGERVRQKRYEQGQSVAAKVQAMQTANPDINLVVVGDFNAFEFTDSYVDVTGHMKGGFVAADNLVCDSNDCPDLVDPNLLNQVLMLPEGERYSFIFRGNAQVLDHALTSSGLDELISGFSYGRGNADAAVDLINDDSTLLRSSDHDGLVLFMAKDSDGDGVTDDNDVCAGTVIPEGAGSAKLGVNRWALNDDDRDFDTTAPNGRGPLLAFDIFDTAGCSCEQIIVEQHLGKGHMKFGCSIGAMRNWVNQVSQP